LFLGVIPPKRKTTFAPNARITNLHMKCTQPLIFMIRWWTPTHEGLFKESPGCLECRVIAEYSSRYHSAKLIPDLDGSTADHTVIVLKLVPER
jgi:hypothetical protein